MRATSCCWVIPTALFVLGSLWYARVTLSQPHDSASEANSKNVRTPINLLQKVLSPLVSNDAVVIPYQQNRTFQSQLLALPSHKVLSDERHGMISGDSNQTSDERSLPLEGNALRLFPLQGDSHKLTELHLKARENVQLWPCKIKHTHTHSGLASTTGDYNISFYVYDLPEELRFKHPDNDSHSNWQFEPHVHSIFLASAYRTYDPSKALFFFVPVQLGLCAMLVQTKSPMGKKCTRSVARRVVEWLNKFGPYWKRNGGADHILTNFFCVGDYRVLNELEELFPPLSAGCGPIYACVSQGRGSLDPHYRYMVLPYYVPDDIFEMGGREFDRRNISFYFAGSYLKTVRVIRMGYKQGTRKPLLDSVQKLPGSVLYVNDGRTALGQFAASSNKIKENQSHSVFVLAPHGDTPESSRIFQALAAGAVPIVTSGKWLPPFAELMDWSEFCIMYDLDRALLYRHYFRSEFNKHGLQYFLQLQQVALQKFVEDLAKIKPYHKRSLLKNVSQVRHEFRWRTGEKSLETLIVRSLAYRTRAWQTKKGVAGFFDLLF